MNKNANRNMEKTIIDEIKTTTKDLLLIDEKYK